jgi:hypothetical protein
VGTQWSPVALADRGAFLRHLTPTRLATPWIALVGPNRRAATIVSISAAGLEVASAYDYPTGSEMAIEFRDRVTRSWHTRRVCVAHCTPQTNQTLIIGALFVEPFTEAEFRALLPDRCG